MAEGWKCPECSLVLAPHITEHRCDPPTAGVTAVPSGPRSPWPTQVIVSAPPVITIAPSPAKTWECDVSISGLSAFADAAESAAAHLRAVGQPAA